MCVSPVLDKHKIMHDTTRTCCILQPRSIPWQVRGRKVAFQVYGVYGLHKARPDSTSYTLVACLDRISCSNQNMRKKQIPLQYLHVTCTYILRPLSAFIRTWLSTRTGTAVPDFLLTYHRTCNIMLRLKTLIGNMTNGTNRIESVQ